MIIKQNPLQAGVLFKGLYF